MFVGSNNNSTPMANKDKLAAQPTVGSVSVEVKELGRNLTGFHQEWISAQGDDGTEYQLSTGAGVGNQYGQFWAKSKDGKSVSLFFDAAQIFHALVDLADAELKKQEVATK